MGLDSSNGPRSGRPSSSASRRRLLSNNGSFSDGSLDPPAALVDDSLALYLHQMGREPLLSAEEEAALAQAIAAGQAAAQRLTDGGFIDGEGPILHQTRQEGAAARARLVRANTRLVVSVAKKYRGRGLSFLDLIQEGNVGLLRAVARFDYRLGHRFSTYATWWIRQGMTRALSNHSRLIRLPAHLLEPLRRLAWAAHELTQEAGRDPTAEELAAYLDMKLNQVQRLLTLRRRTLSLDLPVGDGLEAELGDFIQDDSAPDPEDMLAETQLAEELGEALAELSPREARILRLRFGLRDGRERTLVEIGEMFGLSRERIRQLQKQALTTLLSSAAAERLRHYLER